MSISQVAFWGNAKQGSLRCHFQTYQLRPGEITLLLLNLSPAILKNCIQVIDDTLKDSSLPVCELAAISRKIASDLSPIPWFQNLVKVLPVNQEYTQAYEKWNQLNQPTFEHKLLKIASSGDECPAELPSYDAPRRNECLDAFVTSSAWFAWTCYLVDYDDSSTTPRMVSDLFSVDPLPYAKTYLLALKHFLQETQTLLEELPSYLAALNNSRTFQFGKHYTFDISLNSVHFLLSPYGPSEANIFSLTGLVTLELYYLFKGHSRIKQCALCGQIFFALSSREKYCSNPNPEHHGLPCKVCGPSTIHRKKASRDKFLNVYEKNYKAYHRWKSVALKALSAEPFDDYAGATRMEIESEIKDIYMDWYLQISSVKDAYQAGNLPLEDALEELTLPEIFARSPLYEDWRIYHHDQKIRQREEDGFI